MEFHLESSSLLIACLAGGRQLGDKVIVPPPQDMEAAEARKDEGYEYVDWYFSKKEL